MHMVSKKWPNKWFRRNVMNIIFDVTLHMIRILIGCALTVAGAADAFFFNTISFDRSLVMLGVGIILMDGKK